MWVSVQSLYMVALKWTHTNVLNILKRNVLIRLSVSLNSFPVIHVFLLCNKYINKSEAGCACFNVLPHT